MMSRAAADAVDLAFRIGQNTRCTNFFIAPVRIEHLLEDQIYLPTLYTSGYYSTGPRAQDNTPVGDALRPLLARQVTRR
jgi:hypothetical protein